MGMWGLLSHRIVTKPIRRKVHGIIGGLPYTSKIPFPDQSRGYAMGSDPLNLFLFFFLFPSPVRQSNPCSHLNSCYQFTTLSAMTLICERRCSLLWCHVSHI
uniref:Uncharacterized protein n=1 Tax=Cacopsylla melanoneura TaxID=428564 RepID=A0A8D9AYS1_9HEMI